mgnify:CR=1 FL=1
MLEVLKCAADYKLPEWIAALGALGTLSGVWFVWKQLQLSKEIARLQFVDGLDKEYRELASDIPTKALLGSDLEAEEHQKIFDELFRYFDLSNRQAALWKEKRIDSASWNNWRTGIGFNLQLPAFARAWGEVKLRTEDHASEFFSELRSLEESGFSPNWPRGGKDA